MNLYEDAVQITANSRHIADLVGSVQSLLGVGKALEKRISVAEARLKVLDIQLTGLLLDKEHEELFGNGASDWEKGESTVHPLEGEGPE